MRCAVVPCSVLFWLGVAFAVNYILEQQQRKIYMLRPRITLKTEALDHMCCSRLCEGGELKDFLLGANKKKKKTWQVYMNKQSSREPFWSADFLWRGGS